MRVLYVIDSLAPGGAELSLLHMAPGLIERGIELHVLSLGSRMDLSRDLRSAGATVYGPLPTRTRVGNIQAIRNAIRDLRPDLVHTTLFEAGIAGRVAARLTNTPVSSSVVGDTYGGNTPMSVKLRLARLIDYLTARHLQGLHAVSTSLADAAVKNLKISRGKITVIPRGRNPEDFPFQAEGVRERTRARLGIAPQVPIVLAVGRQVEAKGLIYLMQALPEVARCVPTAVVLLAGSHGTTTGALRAAVGEQPLQVEFLGHRRDIADLLAAADVLCFPSLTEGSPGTLIEAMAVGCPVVASSIPANIEILGGADVGAARLVTPRDSSGLAKSVVEALGDDSGNTTRAGIARRRFERNYTVGAIAEEMDSFFRRMAGFPTGQGEKE